MFDPHRTRRSDSRYFTRKGQVLQASRVNTNPVIDQRLVPIYKNYLIKNNLLKQPPPPPAPPVINPIGIAIKHETDNVPTYYPFTGMNVDRNQTVIINLNGLSTGQAVLLFSRQTNGSFVFAVITYGDDDIYVLTDNDTCYYQNINVASPDKFLDARKSLYHTSASPENIFLTIDQDKATTHNTYQECYIYSPMNIAL